MNKFTSRITATIATGAVLASIVTPAFADTNLMVSGNGTGTLNTVNVNNNSSTTTVQSNNAIVTNNVVTNQTTGLNSANANTGGNVIETTGDASSTTSISNNLNSNQAQVQGNSGAGTQNVTETGNGAGSFNTVNVNNNPTTTLLQNNDASVFNNAVTNQTTGLNAANANTGGSNGGNVIVTTGAAKSTTTETTYANSNVGLVGGSANPGNGSSNLLLSGNGAGSVDTVNLNNNSAVAVAQGNDAVVVNSSETNQFTGGNSADANTGANVTLTTGIASALTQLGTSVNYNAAAVGCDSCLNTGAMNLKVAGEGAGSFSTVNLNDNNEVLLSQGGENGNQAFVSNTGITNGDTGTNAAAANTGAAIFDPVTVTSGNSYSTTDVVTQGNTNWFSSASLPGVSLGFDWTQLWSMMFGL